VIDYRKEESKPPRREWPGGEPTQLAKATLNRPHQALGYLSPQQYQVQ